MSFGLESKVRREGVYALHGRFETDLTREHSVSLRRFDHGLTQQVVGQQMAPHLFLDHPWRLAAQVLHLQRGFQGVEVQFTVPSFAVQRSHFVLGVSHGIQQGGDQNNFLGSKPILLDAEAQLANLHLFCISAGKAS